MSEKEKESKDYWGGSGMVFFTSGKGYAVTDALQTYCMGSEEDALKKEGEEDGTRETDLVGTSDDRTARGKQKTTRQSTPRQRLTSRSPKQKGKNLLRR